MQNFELIEKMESIASSVSLHSLYQQEVDSNLFEENCDYNRDATALYFFPEKEKFGFVPYITREQGNRNVFKSQNVAIFVAYVDAERAIASNLYELIGNMKSVEY